MNYSAIRHAVKARLSYVRNHAILCRHKRVMNRDSNSRKLIGINLLEHLGDIVATEPIARYVKNQNPGCFLVWSVRKQYRELIDANPNVDATLVVYCLSERMMLWKSELFDEVIDLHFADRYCLLCSTPLRKNGSPPINLSNYFHYGNLLSSMAQSAGLPAIDDRPRIYVPVSTHQRVDGLGLPREFIVINCSSNAAVKDWPAEKWIQLLDRIKADYGMPVFEIGRNPPY